MQSEAPRSPSARRWGWPAFLCLLVVQLWAAHACAFFAHEYAHTFVAWILHWKANPLALDYAHPSWTVFLIQFGINQNVDEAPIFASGHGMQAAIISAAGAFLGNALVTLPLSLWGWCVARRWNARGWAMFCYWVCVASIGNLIDYVPIRTFTDGTDLYQDMYAVERGFGWSPWTLLAVFGIPTALILLYFFARIEPRALGWLFPVSTPRRVLLAVLTAFVLFDFYGAAGWSEGGPLSHRMSVISVGIAAPLVSAISGFLVSRHVSVR
ncbi:hypothetical protein HNQ77_003363 [Silvibacterium bohemicum]|uniref:Uncharacterized protein n=1 Tax=Silvibacterium bohemicum TaxID=1577686 RepID=A0A841JXS8_9BACT|nr:hypothetical protein [Silvibacterium bohemicum]MBB6145405.1 hypothetical protein [Silvibacterium bohemicum]